MVPPVASQPPPTTTGAPAPAFAPIATSPGRALDCVQGEGEARGSNARWGMPAHTSRRRTRLLVASLTVVAGAAMLRALPRWLLYPAPGVPVPTPPAPWEEIRILQRAGEEVYGWWRPPSRPGAVVLFFHGNGENLGTLARGGFLEDLVGVGAAALVVDYPGYGYSTGTPHEAALHATADAVLAWVEERREGRAVVVWGWSLGAAVAIPLAARGADRVTGLIAASPWTRLEDVAAVHFPRPLVRLLLRERYDSLAAAPTVTVPALVLHGAADTIIPAAQGRQVAAALAGPTRYVEVAGVGHNDLLSHTQVWREVAAFVQSLPGAEKTRDQQPPPARVESWGTIDD